MSAADDGAAREHHLWILDLESAAGRTMAEASLWAENERGYGSRCSRDREVDRARETRLVARHTIGARGAWILYRVSRVKFALSLGHLKTWLLNDQKVAFGDLIEHCLSQAHTGRKSGCQKEPRFTFGRRFPVSATCDGHYASPDRQWTQLQSRSFGIQCDRQ